MKGSLSKQLHEEGAGAARTAARRASLPRAPENPAFFLDVDGTLLAIAETPHEVRPDPGIVELLERLHQAAGGAVALISGRPIEDLDRLFAPVTMPAAGQHGTERRDASGQLHRHAFGAGRLGNIRHRVRDIAARCPGTRVEDKGITVAVHYRQVPECEARLASELGPVVEEAGEEFRLQRGKMVFEIKPAGKDKGTAIAEFMREAPFCGRTPVFLGDDVTDEDGFSAVNAMGGQSIKVGGGPSAARWRLADVDAVRAWLEAHLRIARADGRRKRGSAGEQP